MLREKEKENKLFYNFKIDDYIPEDHFLRLVDKYLSFNFIRERVKHLYSHTGQPAIDPVVLVKMLLIGYFYSIKSERQLEKEIQVNLAYRWFIKYDIDEKIPDHSTISQTRRRKFTGSTVFQELFDEIVRQCISVGLIKGETIITDSTHIKANASYESLVEIVITPDEYIEQLELKSKSSDCAKQTGRDNNNKDDLRVMKKRRYSNSTHRSKSDPDSRLMGRRGKPNGLHYFEHRSIDASGYITDVHITPANIQDNEPYIERIRRQKWAFKFPIRNVVADRAYGVGAVYKELTDMNINAYIDQYTRQDKREGMFDHDNFKYYKEGDYYICPNGKKLRRKSKKPIKGISLEYAARKKDCNSSCKFRKQCMISLKGNPKKIRRHVFHEYIENQISKRGSPEWNKLLKIRKTLIEGSFADAKNNHRLNRAKMRGIKNVQEQSLMTAVVQNIKKMIKNLSGKFTTSNIHFLSSIFFQRNFILLN